MSLNLIHLNIILVQDRCQIYILNNFNCIFVLSRRQMKITTEILWKLSLLPADEDVIVWKTWAGLDALVFTASSPGHWSSIPTGRHRGLAGHPASDPHFYFFIKNRHIRKYLHSITTLRFHWRCLANFPLNHNIKQQINLISEQRT